MQTALEFSTIIFDDDSGRPKWLQVGWRRVGEDLEVGCLVEVKLALFIFFLILYSFGIFFDVQPEN